MASRPNPSWSEPQKKVYKAIQEATEVVIPYFGEEIPDLGNKTPAQICDDLGVVKQAKKAIEKVEKTLGERFKPQMGTEKELRGTRYVATQRSSERTALNQSRCKELIEAADNAGLDLQILLKALRADSDAPNFIIPEEFELTGEKSNLDAFNTFTNVSALYVEPIA